MNPRFGWALALIALGVGGATYGWRGLALAVSVVAFWLLLQLNRSVRVMRAAAAAPVGALPSAVMLQAKLRVGMPMLQVVAETKSLGRPLDDPPGTWAWTDAGGDVVRVTFRNGRCTAWQLIRLDAGSDSAAAGESLSSAAIAPVPGSP